MGNRSSLAIDRGSSAPAETGRAFLRVLAVVAAAFGALLYVNTLNNPFTVDDYHLLVENPYIGKLSDLQSILLRDITRPVVTLSYVVDTAIWGREPFGYRVTNILLHAINVILVFWVALLACEDRQRQRRRYLDGASSPALAAFAAACLFAVHPMMTQAVGYIAGRSEVAYCCIFLSAFLAGRRWILFGRRRWLFACSVLWAAGILTKESAAMLPFVLIAYSWLLLEPLGKERKRRLFAIGLPLLVVTILAIASRIAVLRFVEYSSVGIDGRFSLVAVDAFWRYLSLFALPQNQAFFHALPMPDQNPPLRVIAGVVGMLALPPAIWALRRVHSVMAFGGAWFLLMLAPSSVLFTLGIGEPLAEHRAYVAGAGLFLVWGSAFDLLWQRTSGRVPLRAMVGVTAALFVVQLSLRTLERNAIWGDPVALARESVALAPDHWFPKLLLGDAYRRAGRCDEAIPAFRHVLALRPQDVKANLNLTSCLIQEKRFGEAEAVMTELEAVNPASRDAVMTLGVLAALANDPGRAEAWFMTATRRHPQLEDAHRMLAFMDGALPQAEHRQLCEELRSMAGSFDVEACLARQRSSEVVRAQQAEEPQAD